MTQIMLGIGPHWWPDSQVAQLDLTNFRFSITYPRHPDHSQTSINELGLALRHKVVMYESLRRATDGGRDSNEIELLQPHGHRQGSSSIRSSDDYTIDSQRSPSLIELLHSAKTTDQSDDSDNLLQKHSGHREKLPEKKFLLSGWRTGALISLIGAVVVFVFNLGITIWVWANPSFQANGAIGTMYRGNCTVVRNLNVRIHLLVNVLSTMLLCGSNYVMQVLAAPNREDVDRAHAQRRWLHIGVPNFRNLRYIRRERVIIYMFLFLSSVPLHLLFNSVVFTQLQANEYSVVPTMEDWIQGGEYNLENFDDLALESSLQNKIWIREFEQYRVQLDDTVKLSNGTTVPKYQNMTAAECFSKYGNHYVSDVGNVYLVQAQPTVWKNPGKSELRRLEGGGFEWAQITNDSSILDDRNGTYHRVDFNATLPFPSSPRRYPSNLWRCQSHTSTGCDPDDESEIPRDRSQWKPYGSDLSYCLVEQVEEFCELQFSFAIAILVIISNLVKATCMAIALWKCGGHGAFVTIGDAIASFLDNPDPSTSGRCLQTRRHVELWWDWNEWAMGNSDIAMKRDRRRFRSRRRKWAMAPSERRWVATYWSYSVLFIAGIPLTVLALKNMPRDPKKLWETGFGTIQGNNLLNFDTSLMGGVLLANTPQALLSYMYLAFNALYTTMFISSEWASYSVQRKPLRVTSPVGQQRHTYWLGVPYRYAIPVTLVSGLFHWLASQSLFKVQISVTDMFTRQVKDHISTCGYSPVPIMLTMAVATVVGGSGIAISRISFPSGMPLAASNSAAISAACHPPKEDSDASVLPVQWGAVSHENDGEFTRDENVGHCCFTSFPVEPPIEGHLYQ